MNEVVVVDYDPAWAHAFQALRACLEPALTGVATRIEHVGSTAVRGLSAKPIVDLDVVVLIDPDVPRAIEVLEGLGYQHRGDLGITGREAFLAPAGAAPHHLYVCVEGSLALRNHLAVRDVLRQDAELASEYSAIKLRLAKRFPNDIEGYIEGKSEVLQRILARGGLVQSEVATIERANRRPE